MLREQHGSRHDHAAHRPDDVSAPGRMRRHFDMVRHRPDAGRGRRQVQLKLHSHHDRCPLQVMAMAVSPLIAPDDDGEIDPVVFERVLKSLTAKDLLLLEKLEAEKRIDVETLDSYDTSNFLWLSFFGLCGVDVDPGDRVFLVKKKEGKAAIDALRGVERPSRKRRGRPLVVPRRRQAR